MAKAPRSDSAKWKRRAAVVRVAASGVCYPGPRPGNRLTSLDVAYHVACGYKNARPDRGKDWMMLVEVASKLDEDLSDLWAHAPAVTKLVMLPMEVVWRPPMLVRHERDRFSEEYAAGRYVWVRVPRGQRTARRLRLLVEAARAEILLLGRKS